MYKRLLYYVTDHKRKPTKLNLALVLLIIVLAALLYAIEEPLVLWNSLFGIYCFVILLLFGFFSWRRAIEYKFSKAAKKSQLREPGFVTHLVASEKRLRD